MLAVHMKVRLALMSAQTFGLEAVNKSLALPRQRDEPTLAATAGFQCSILHH